jgi:hypothetical protein
MATCYYRMNSLFAAEAVMRRLESEPGFSPSRPLGYAYRKVVRVDSADGVDPERFVREVDPGARLVPKPTNSALAFTSPAAPEHCGDLAGAAPPPTI